MAGFITLQTDRLILRDHRLDDLETHHELFSNPEAMYYLPDIKTCSAEESRLNLVECLVDIYNPERTKYFLRIEMKDSKEHVGEIGYTVSKSTPVGKLVDLGYFIYPKYWSKGFVTEAVTEILRYAFEENNVCRISTGCLKDNIGSERVMQKYGMIKEAELKKYTWHDGQLKDRVEYRLLKQEWDKENHLFMA